MIKKQSSIFHVSLLQFLFFAAYGAGVPYLSLYYRSVLLDSNGIPNYSAVGTALFVSMLIGVVSPLIAGYLADRFRIQHRLISFLSFMVFFGGILFTIPGLPIFSGLGFSWRFILILAGAATTGLFVRPLMPLIDSETLNTLHELNIDRSRYGTVRVFGSIGWVVTASILGLLLQKFNAIVIAALGYTLGFLVLTLFGSSGIKPRLAAVKIPWNHLKQDRTFRRFLVFISILSMGMTGGYVFTSIFLKDAGASYLTIGIAFSVSAIPEIPILFFGRSLLSRFGNRKLILVGTILQMLKFVFLFLIAESGSSTLFIVVLLLQGTGYSTYFLGAIDLLDRLSHKHLRSTYQSMYHLFFALAGAFGTLLASFVTDTFSAKALMGLSAIYIFISIIYFLFSLRTTER
jgi:PPP family 3-phenylpropionic acid transporter